MRIFGKPARQYHPEDYDDLYFSCLEDGLAANPVSMIHCLDIMAVLVGSTILSIGCGTGQMEHRMKERMPWVTIKGTEMFATKTQQTLWGKYGLDVEIADACTQPFGSDSFDSVFTSHVLEHIQCPEAAIVESIRVSRFVAAHLVPVNLNNPDHIHFFKFNGNDNRFRTQKADIDLKKLSDSIVARLKGTYPSLEYRMQISCPRDGSRDYGNMEFPIKKRDRPDGLMPCFLVTFYKAGYRINHRQGDRHEHSME